MQVLDVLIRAQSPRDPTQFSWLLQLAPGLPGRARAVYVLCQSLLYTQIFLDAGFGSEVSPISTLRFAERCLYISLVVLVACLSSLQWQTHISRSVSGEQVPAFLKINLLF